MTEKPLVSVITAVYNIVKNGRTDFLIQNFESVHNQTYPNIEHLVIDGASDDGTVELLKKYADKGYIRYVSEPDNGIYDAINKGHKTAQGEYAIILNSDDYYAADDVIECMVAKLLETGADYAYAGQNVVALNGEKTDFWQKPAVHMFWAWMPFNHPTMMIKNAIVKKQGYYRTDFDTVADNVFITRLILDDYKGVEVDKVVLNYRLGGATCDGKTLYSMYDFKYRRLPMFYKWFYSQFDDRLDEEKIIGNYMDILGGKFDDLFFIRLIRFMLNKKLKNFDYEAFLKGVLEYRNRLAQITDTCSKAEAYANSPHTAFYYFCGLPLLKVKTDGAGNQHYKLFFLLPVLKICCDKDKGRTYKLFSFLPLFRTKRYDCRNAEKKIYNELCEEPKGEKAK